jgi:hypothetical protein
MQNPEERVAGTRERDTGVMPADSLGQYGLEPLNEAPSPYAKEPLFNKKVMLAWALAAFAVWWGVNMIAPMVIDTVRTSINEAVQEVETGSDGTITIRRNGKVISITRGPNPTVIVQPEGKAAPPAPTTPATRPTPAPLPESSGELPAGKR